MTASVIIALAALCAFITWWLYRHGDWDCRFVMEDSDVRKLQGADFS